MRLFLLALQLILLTIIVAQAETVDVVEEGNNTVILMVEIQDQDGLGSFSLTLKYDPNMTKILNVSREGPFTVVDNINNELGVAKIAGFHGQVPGPTGEIRLARLYIDGSAEFKIVEIKLYDTKGNPITYQLTSTTPDTSPTTTTPLEQTITTITTTVTTLTVPSETTTSVETTTVTIQHLPTKPIERITQTTPKEISKEISKNNTTTTPTTNPTKPTAVIPDFSAASSILVIILTVLLVLRKRKH